MTASFRCISFTDVNGAGVGGKAQGLIALALLALPVPDGFVISNPTPILCPRNC